MSSLDEAQWRNVELVRQAVEAFRRGDLEGVLRLFDEDLEIFLPQSFPNSGRYVGREGFLSWIGQWLDAWDDFAVEIERIEPVGERHVVADMHQSARGKGSGIAVEMDVAYLWEAREGELAAMQIYASRAEALEVAERRERGAAD
jgi:ketosteroid isomerase-like protein